MSANAVLGRINDVFGRPPEQEVKNKGADDDEHGTDGVSAHERDMLDLDRFIDVDIARRLEAPNTSWRRLDTCVKWRLLQEHFAGRDDVDEKGRSRLLSKARAMLSGGDIEVVYDPAGRVVTDTNVSGTPTRKAAEPNR